MLRSLALLLTFLAATPALATDLQSRSESRSVSLQAVAGFAVIGDFQRGTEVTGAGQHRSESSQLGLAWQAGGFKVAATSGVYAYDLTGVGTGQGRASSLAVSHELATAGGGTLAVELRHTRAWEGSSTLDARSARLGWSLKF